MAALGAIAAARGEAEQAATWFGAAEAMYQAAGAWSFIAARRQHRQAIEAVRAELGEDAFAAAWERGRRLSGEQATAEALQTAASPRLAPA